MKVENIIKEAKHMVVLSEDDLNTIKKSMYMIDDAYTMQRMLDCCGIKIRGYNKKDAENLLEDMKTTLRCLEIAISNGYYGE